MLHEAETTKYAIVCTSTLCLAKYDAAMEQLPFAARPKYVRARLRQRAETRTAEIDYALVHPSKQAFSATVSQALLDWAVRLSLSSIRWWRSKLVKHSVEVLLWYARGVEVTGVPDHCGTPSMAGESGTCAVIVFTVVQPLLTPFRHTCGLLQHMSGSSGFGTISSSC
jgi:hypothetical protein